MTDATVMLKQLAEPWQPGEFVKDVIARVAPAAGLDYWRAFDIWYRKARKVEAAELAQIVDALDKKNERALWNDYQDIKRRMAAFDAKFAAYGQNIDRALLDADRPALRVAGGTRRAGGRG